MESFWTCEECGKSNNFPNTSCEGCDTFKPPGWRPYAGAEDDGVPFPPKALDHQVGGTHYVTMEIQPVEYIVKNELEFLPGCIVKRISRYDRPGGKGVEDLKKIKHECDLLMALKFGDSV